MEPTGKMLGKATLNKEKECGKGHGTITAHKELRRRVQNRDDYELLVRGLYLATGEGR